MEEVIRLGKDFVLSISRETDNTKSSEGGY